MQERVMIQIMKLVKYKYLSVNLNKKNKRKQKENKIKELQDKIKKLKLQVSCQKCFIKLQTMKNTQSKIKPIKIGKKLGTTHCLGC